MELPRAIFDVKSVDAGAYKNRKLYKKFRIILESCKETSKLSADNFFGVVGPHGSSEMRFLKKKSSKKCPTRDPPPANLTV